MKSKELAQILIELAHQVDKVDDAISVFVAFLEKHNLTYQLPAIVRHISQFKYQKDRTSTLVIESPFEIANSLQKKIQHFTNAQDAQFVEFVINKNLLGGFRTTYKGLVTDASIRHNLLTLKKELSK
jgi:F0F1-type ATP synthase delta subunit